MTGPAARRKERQLGFFDAALTALRSGSADDLKLRALCRSIGCTTGAFYQLFESRDAFTHQLLAHWVTKEGAHLDELARGIADPVDRLRALLVPDPHSQHLSTTIRLWADSDPVVRRALDDFDARRLVHVRRAVGEIVTDEPEAFAKWLMVQFLGFEHSAPADLRMRRWSLVKALQLVPDDISRSDPARDSGERVRNGNPPSTSSRSSQEVAVR
jgi:AcrR family transcriptional regulator